MHYRIFLKAAQWHFKLDFHIYRAPLIWHGINYAKINEKLSRSFLSKSDAPVSFFFFREKFLSFTSLGIRQLSAKRDLAPKRKNRLLRNLEHDFWDALEFYKHHENYSSLARNYSQTIGTISWCVISWQLWFLKWWDRLTNVKTDATRSNLRNEML